MQLGFAILLLIFSTASADCPTVGTTCPATVESGQPITMTAQVEGGDVNVTPTYNWVVSAGTIESGQGTSVITIVTTDLEPDSTVTATVEVGGYDRSCPTTASCSTSVTKPE